MPVWMADASCQDFPLLPWIAPRECQTCVAELEMVIICSLCPVREECETYARAHGITSGFWAGRERGTLVESVEQDGAA